MSLHAEISDVGGRAVVTLAGSVDLSTVPTLQNTLMRVVLERPGETIAIDLDAVDTIDDVGLGILLGAAGRARRRDGDLLIVCSNPALRDRFAETGLDRAVTVRAALSG